MGQIKAPLMIVQGNRVVFYVVTVVTLVGIVISSSMSLSLSTPKFAWRQRCSHLVAHKFPSRGQSQSCNRTSTEVEEIILVESEVLSQADFLTLAVSKATTLSVDPNDLQDDQSHFFLSGPQWPPPAHGGPRPCTWIGQSSVIFNLCDSNGWFRNQMNPSTNFW